MSTGRTTVTLLLAVIVTCQTGCSRFSYREVRPSTFEIYNRSDAMIETIIVEGYSYAPLTSEPTLIRNQELYRQGMTDRYRDRRWLRIDLAPGDTCTIQPTEFFFVPESLSDPGPDADLDGIKPVGQHFQPWEPPEVTRPIPIARDERQPVPVPMDWESLLLFDFTRPFEGTD